MSAVPWWSWLIISILAVISLGLAIALVFFLRWLTHLFDGF